MMSTIKNPVFLLLFFFSHSDGVKYIGCYKDEATGSRLMTGDSVEFPNTLTSEICINHCKSKNMNYAGLQYSFQCFCDHRRPSFIHLAEPSNCDMKCDGNQSEICGGGFRISLYDIAEKGEKSQIKNYLGCFDDSTDETINSPKIMVFPNLNSPDYCIGQCWREGYRFAGLKSGSECHCGDSTSLIHKTNEFECTSPCPANKNLHCGENLKLDLYKTGITDVSSLGKLLGCYKDEGTRALPGIELWLPSTNSPAKCISICLFLGYRFAGVEYRVQCFCGNTEPDNERKVIDKECHIKCPVESEEFCGGNWRVMIYKTDLNVGSTITVKPTGSSTLSTISTTPVNHQSPQETLNCGLSLTTVKGEVVCSGQIVFSEDFKGPIKRQRWQHTVMMPTSPDYEFVTYTRNKNISFIEDGKLKIKPSLYEDDFIRNGRLNLQGCTGDLFTDECERQAVGFVILPPVESARITTKESFSFRYGRVDIRARFPLGDWVYPELWLEPKRSIYGPQYSSGRMRIATARGNPILLDGKKDLGNNLLESGVLVGLGDKVKDLTVQRVSRRPWSSDFHNYSVIWTPDNIEFLVDGEKNEKLLPTDKTDELINLLELNSTEQWSFRGVRVTPFDQEFYLNVGLSVGGIRYFPDGTYSSGNIKPWINFETKAMANFYKAQNDWLATWSEENTLLEVDSIQVVAL